jgi:flagellar protein FlbD
MINLTRLNGEKIAINVELIEYMEETPDTVITLTTGKKFIVKEPVKKIQEQVIAFRKRIHTDLKK